MASEELSQDEIDNLFSTEDSDESSAEGVNPLVKEFSNLLNSSIEDVLKTAFSLEVVSKFIDLNVKKKDEISFEEGVFLFLNVGVEETKTPCFIYIKKEFASILSDLMLMGPGEAKEKLEPDDLDAIKELFSQVFGNLQTSFKEQQQKELVVEITDVKEEQAALEGESFYDMEFDIAIPNIKSDSIILFAEKSQLDGIFKQEKEGAEPEELQEETLPFENVESSKTTEPEAEYIKGQNGSGNLDLIMDVDLDVKIRIGEKNMLIKDILKLKEGSIVELEKNIEEPMEILINNKVVAKGVVVVVGGRFGVKITNIDTKEERIKSLGG